MTHLNSSLSASLSHPVLLSLSPKSASLYLHSVPYLPSLLFPPLPCLSIFPLSHIYLSFSLICSTLPYPPCLSSFLSLSPHLSLLFFPFPLLPCISSLFCNLSFFLFHSVPTLLSSPISIFLPFYLPFSSLFSQCYHKNFFQPMLSSR